MQPNYQTSDLNHHLALIISCQVIQLQRNMPTVMAVAVQYEGVPRMRVYIYIYRERKKKKKKNASVYIYFTQTKSKHIKLTSLVYCLEKTNRPKQNRTVFKNVKLTVIDV